MPSAEAAVQVTQETKSWRRFVDPLILVTLGAFAVTQPLLSDFRDGAGYFVARRNEPIDIVLLVVVLTLVPGLIANLIVWAADGFSDAARRVVQSTFVGIFVALISHTTFVRITSINWVVLLVVSAFIGVLAGWAYGRSKWFKTFLTYLIPAPLIFALFFLATPPVSALVFPSSITGVEAGVASDTPVVFVVFDEFPLVSLLNAQGGIDANRFPNFATLASMSTWYKYTAAAHDYTWWAVPPLLTGQLPDSSRLPTAANYPGNLFTLLDDSHDLHVVEPFTRLCPPEACGQIRPTSTGDRLKALVTDSLTLYGMMLTPDAKGGASVSDPFNEFRRGAAGVIEDAPTDQIGQFARFLGGISPGSQVHYIHLLFPHAPFSYYPSGSEYNDGVELAGRDAEEVWLDPVLANEGHQRHLLQVQIVDRMIGDMLDRLEAVGILDQAIVVVAADHGAAFQFEAPRRAATNENAYDVGLVPLFIKAPNQEDGIVDSIPSRTVDVLPTVADYLGLELPWDHEGQSLVSDQREMRPLEVEARAGHIVELSDPEGGVQSAVMRLQSVFGTRGGSLELYSLGDYDAVLGQSPEQVVVGSSGLMARVDEAWRLAHVAPKTGFFVPGFVHGHLKGDVGEELHVGVAVNGEIGTIVPVFDVDGDGARFNAIVPDESFVAGFNDLEIVAISGPSDAPTVESIGLEGHTKFDMESADSGRVTRLTASSGTFWPVVEQAAIDGSIDDAAWYNTELQRSSPQDLHLNGWAVDPTGTDPVERVVFFVNGTFAGSTPLDIERPDIEDAYESAVALMSGFVGKLSHFVPSDNLDVRAFALSGGIAKELPITDEAQEAITAG